MMVSENYPNLKSNQSSRNCGYNWKVTENRIAVERKATTNQSGIQHVYRQFPNNIIAGFAGAGRKVAFSADAGAATAPKVKFNTKTWMKRSPKATFLLLMTQ
jgi:LemA protein